MAEPGWMPNVIWRLDKNVKGLREEVPWVPAAERVHRRPGPLHHPAAAQPKRRDHVGVLCEIAQAERTLVFSSDYPHWDFDDSGMRL